MIVRIGRTVAVSAMFLTALVGPTSAPAFAQTQLTLQDALQLARSRRAEIAGADLEVKLARLGVLRAALDRVRLRVDGHWGEQAERLYMRAPPSLCASIEGLCQPAQRRQVMDLSASLEVSVWTGWQLESQWTRARALERAAEAGKRSRLRQLELEVASAYWTVRLAELLRDAAGRAHERRSEVAELIKARAEAGLAPRTDRDRAELAALRQQALLAELTGRAEQARSDLAAVLQLPGDQPLELTDDPARSTPVLPPLATVLAESESRPELEQLRAQLVAQEQSARAARGGWWPHLQLFARAEARNEALGVPQPNLIGHLVAGVQLRWQLFDSLSTWQAVRIADLERHRSALDQERAHTIARAQVRTAHSQLATALARREPLGRALSLARSTLESVRRRYQSGAAILLELLEAEDELQELDAAVSTSAVDTALAEAALQAARGQLGR